MSEPTPNPGSPEAQGRGCTCPVMDNAHGKGWMRSGDLFVINCTCPLHGTEAKK